jgi:D-glycero-beta-D-manno-heptose 1-phosphate adenylyltransferase
MIVPIDNLAGIRHQHAGQKLVMTSGTFDLFHVGHLNYLKQVKDYGDAVLVLLSSDKRVSARKGEKRPIIPEDDRARILDALKMVDYVLIDPFEPTPDTHPGYQGLIAQLQPDCYVTDGYDSRFDKLIDPSKFIVLDRAEGGRHVSTSAIIDHIVRQTPLQ